LSWSRGGPGGGQEVGCSGSGERSGLGWERGWGKIAAANGNQDGADPEYRCRSRLDGTGTEGHATGLLFRSRGSESAWAYIDLAQIHGYHGIRGVRRDVQRQIQIPDAESGGWRPATEPRAVARHPSPTHTRARAPQRSRRSYPHSVHAPLLRRARRRRRPSHQPNPPRRRTPGRIDRQPAPHRPQRKCEPPYGRHRPWAQPPTATPPRTPGRSPAIHLIFARHRRAAAPLASNHHPRHARRRLALRRQFRLPRRSGRRTAASAALAPPLSGQARRLHPAHRSQHRRTPQGPHGHSPAAPTAKQTTAGHRPQGSHCPPSAKTDPERQPPRYDDGRTLPTPPPPRTGPTPASRSFRALAVHVRLPRCPRWYWNRASVRRSLAIAVTQR
jgi:hypothetical protein